MAREAVLHGVRLWIRRSRVQLLPAQPNPIHVGDDAALVEAAMDAGCVKTVRGAPMTGPRWVDSHPSPPGKSVLAVPLIPRPPTGARAGCRARPPGFCSSLVP